MKQIQPMTMYVEKIRDVAKASVVPNCCSLGENAYAVQKERNSTMASISISGVSVSQSPQRCRADKVVVLNGRNKTKIRQDDTNSTTSLLGLQLDEDVAIVSR